jgi:hypothetical protein
LDGGRKPRVVLFDPQMKKFAKYDGKMTAAEIETWIGSSVVWISVGMARQYRGKALAAWGSRLGVWSLMFMVAATATIVFVCRRRRWWPSALGFGGQHKYRRFDDSI